VIVVEADDAGRLQSILKEIHVLMKEESPTIISLREEAWNIIRNSNLTYREIYCLFKKYTENEEEFNLVMAKVRKIVNMGSSMSLRSE